MTSPNPPNSPRPQTDSPPASEQSISQPWQRPTRGAWLLVLLGVLALFGLVIASGNVWQADGRGEDDAGVVHPQPLGVDNDVAPRYDDS